MSNVQRGLFKKKIEDAEARMGVNPLQATDKEEEEDEEQDAVAPLSSMPAPSRRQRVRSAPEPEPWDHFFEQMFDIKNERGTFRVYYTPPNTAKSPVFVFQHGAGSSALTFALMAKRLREKMQTPDVAPAKSDISDEVAGVMAFDMRGHGGTTVNGDTADFALDTVTSDFLSVIESVWERNGWEGLDCPSLIVVGHSLGGSIVAEAATRKNALKKLVGVVILDVVEGLTMESLDSMNKVLATFPNSFDSPGAAIQWHLAHRHLQNRDSAVVSVPPLLREDSSSGKWTWVMDLKATEPYWKGWFEGLSGKFLKAPAARLLILAGTDRLDKELMIGQMQGKYQLMVFNEAGHFLHEDSPDKTALTLIDFWSRNGRPANITPVFGKLRDPAS